MRKSIGTAAGALVATGFLWLATPVVAGVSVGADVNASSESEGSDATQKPAGKSSGTETKQQHATHHLKHHVIHHHKKPDSGSATTQGSEESPK
jgi:hypothetical protein